MTMSTYKSLGGPPSGLIVTGDDADNFVRIEAGDAGSQARRETTTGPTRAER